MCVYVSLVYTTRVYNWTMTWDDSPQLELLDFGSSGTFFYLTWIHRDIRILLSTGWWFGTINDG